MATLLEQFAQFIEVIVTSIGYPGIAILMFVENIVPPIPSEMVMPFAGFLANRGEFTLVLVILAGTFGSVLGAVALYIFGAQAGDPIMRRFLRRYGEWLGVSEADYERVLRVFDRYGNAIVFFGRLLPLIRSLISIPAGAHHMPMGKFMLYTTMGSLIWATVMTYAGYLLGENWDQVLGWVEQYQSVTIVIGVIVFGGATVFWIYSRVRAANQRAAVSTKENLPVVD